MAFLAKIFGDANERYLQALALVIREINGFASEFETLSDGELKGKTAEFRKRFSEGEALDDLLPEAFAAVREAARRRLNQRHFDVQLLGGIVLHKGAIPEMRTGEGKTLVATLPLYLNALTGKGAHLVTPNDYLSRVGGGWMGPVYRALGMSTGVIAHDFSGIYDPEYQESPSHGDPRLDHWRPVSRQEAYAADITYGTNNEFGFDYLRDNMAYESAQQVQFGGRKNGAHHYAIVDEVDSILIDEARTPLIISAPDEESSEYYQTFARIVPQLSKDSDYNVDEKLKAVSITEEGIDKVEKLLGVKNIYEERGFRYVRYLEQALRAAALFERDRDYVVKENQVIIVDEFTGRLMPGRRWSEGLHQAIEAKEGVEIQRESRTLASITFQNYFRMYEKLAGMTGTAATSAEEFHKVYKMDVVIIPTNKPLVREDFADLVFRTEHGKFLAITREIKERHQKNQPILVGTVSIEKNERLSEYLKREGVPHQMLNAKNHEAEAMVIAQAGRRKAVTLATNMAGRGVDIVLGGSPTQSPGGVKNPLDAEEAAAVREAGGLHVIGTERHEARRIDNQLRGRAGRQGDSGSSQFFLSLEDDLMRIFGSGRIKSMMESFGIPEDEAIQNRMVTRSIEAAQSKIEGFHFDARKHVLEFDDVMNRQREYIYRLRREILADAESEPLKLVSRLDEMIGEEISKIIEFHTAGEYAEEWNIGEIFETISAVAEIPGGFKDVLERIAKENISAGDRRRKLGEFVTGGLKALSSLHAQSSDWPRSTLRVVMLQAIDILWMDHLDQMEHLRDSVRLRAYGQRDPLVEYKNEGLRLFRELQAAIRSQIIGTIFKVSGQVRVEQPRRVEERHPVAAGPAGIGENIAGFGNPYPAASPMGAVPRKPPVGRNDPCPCGATHPDGRPIKYKHCHGKNA